MSDFIGYIEALTLRNSQPAEEQGRAPALADPAFNMKTAKVTRQKALSAIRKSGPRRENAMADLAKI